MKKKLSILVSALFCLVVLATTASAIDYEIYGLDVEYPTQEQIALYYQTYDMGKGVSDTYAVEPVLTAPYAAGVLSNTTLTQGLNTVNYVRYIAGLNWDVTLNDSFNTYAAASSLVNRISGGLSHYPTQPADMDYSLYIQGYSGAGKSNISYGSSTLYYNIINGWMGDYSSQANLDAVGHRRWILNPAMTATGFGAAGTYRSMYVSDYSNLYNNTASQTTVAWPAQNTPVSVFGSSYPWSYSQSGYISTSVATTVTLTRLSDGATWNFNTKDADTTDGYITISNAGYGTLKGCLIFRPSSVSYSDGDVFNVHIEGGVEANYFVTFFDETAVEVTTTSFTTTATPTVSDAYLYGASAFAVESITQAKETGLISDDLYVLGNYQQAITREEFCTLAVSLYQRLGGSVPKTYTDPFTDTDNPVVLQAYALGIVNGKTDTTFLPDDSVTRQEIAAMLYRLLCQFGECTSTQDLTQFTDYTVVSSWAVDALAYLNEIGVINGTSTTTITPWGNTTREQAIVMAMRTVDAMGK